MVRNIKETFLPKTEMREKIQGMLKTSKMHGAYPLQNYIEFIYFLSKTSKMCTMCMNYNVDSNSKYSN